MTDSPKAVNARLHARVYGWVQGVGFRAYVLRQAQQLGLTGWVRNRRDGSVEVVAEGPRGALEDLLRRLQQGPTLAQVTRVEATWEPPSAQFRQFEIRGTL